MGDKKKAKGPKNYTSMGLSVYKIREVLRDGEWRTMSWITSQLFDEVRPEGAIRVAKAIGHKNITPERAVERAIINRVAKLTAPYTEKSGHIPQIEKKEVNGTTYYRLREEYRGRVVPGYSPLSKRQAKPITLKLKMVSEGKLLFEPVDGPKLISHREFVVELSEEDRTKILNEVKKEKN